MTDLRFVFYFQNIFFIRAQRKFNKTFKRIGNVPVEKFIWKFVFQAEISTFSINLFGFSYLEMHANVNNMIDR